MTAISSAKKSSRGRPRIDATPVNVRLPPDQLDPLDAWIAAQPDPKPSRPEAIRKLLDGALAEGTRRPFELPHVSYFAKPVTEWTLADIKGAFREWIESASGGKPERALVIKHTVAHELADEGVIPSFHTVSSDTD